MKASSSTRRGLFKSTTGAGLLICSSRVAFGYQANERLNVACIGVGGQGEGNVNNVFGENIVALCDDDTKRGPRSLAKFPDVKHYTDFRACREGWTL